MNPLMAPPRKHVAPSDLPNPSGFCMCGCGQPAPIAPKSDRRDHVIGQPMRYVHGHNRRDPRPSVTVSCACGCGLPLKTKMPDTPTYGRGHHMRTRESRGPKNGFWKGGRVITHQGYVAISLPQHPLAYRNGYVLEHRLVWFENTGHQPGHDEVVHHINGNKTDNRFANLQLLTDSEHRRLHAIAKHSQRRG